MKKGDKKGQFQIGFGMIFSIILMAAFLVVAIIAINAFLKVSCSIETGSFINDLDNEVNRIRKGSGEDTVKEFKINWCDFEYVCFYNLNEDDTGNYASFTRDFRISTGDEGDHNLYFYPRSKSDVPSTLIKHVNMELSSNPYCFKKVDNKVRIRLTKSTSEALVRVS